MKNQTLVLQTIANSISKISRMRVNVLTVFTFKETIIYLGKSSARKIDHDQMSIILDSGLYIDQGWFEDEVTADKSKHCFGVKIYREFNNSEIYVYFDQNKKAYFEDDSKKKNNDLFIYLGIENLKKTGWKQALDCLFEISKIVNGGA